MQWFAYLNNFLLYLHFAGILFIFGVYWNDIKISAFKKFSGKS